MESEIHAKFPLLTFWKNKTYWNGFIKVHNSTLVKLAITVPNYPSVKSAILEGDQDTLDLINVGHTKDQLHKILNTDITLQQFLEAFKDLLENEVEEKTETTTIQVWDPQIYAIIVTELQEIGFDNIPFVSTDLKEIHVTQSDPSGRTHIIRFIISHMYPRKGLKVFCDLPSTETIIWPNNISDCLVLLAKYLEKYNEFWTEMHEIDEKVQILDPCPPNPSHVHRRILMGNKVIIHLVINPLKPRAFPTLQFYGPEKKTDELEDAVTRHCGEWLESRSIFLNIEYILGVELPPKGSEMISADEVKCTICYMYELEGDPPEKTCSCGSLFHNKCIHELFINESADNIRRKAVDCPVCSQEISLQ